MVNAIACLGGLLATAVSCGSRTGLFTSPGIAFEASTPADVPDANRDERGYAAAPDAPPGAADESAVAEASTPCVGDAIYLATAKVAAGSPVRYALETFSPVTGLTAPVGPLDCPAPEGIDPQPTSLAVDRQGRVYIFVNETRLFRFRIDSQTCESTGFSVASSYDGAIGAAFATDRSDSADTLYMLASKPDDSGPVILASIDTQSFATTIAGSFPFGTTKLTGTGAGDLFAHTAGALWRLDPTGTVASAEWTLPWIVAFVEPFAFWGGAFYQFNGGPSGKAVLRFRAGDPTAAQVAQTADSVLAAGVSTCAPLQ
jgi:hypothetical protein